MPSPVDTSVKHFHSGMTGAPVLSGTAGTLIGLLDACLVNGWGLQTATSVVVASGVATVTFSTAFPATVDSVILVSGATPAGLNGEQKVTQILTATNQIRFATAEADGTATGTITVRMAPAGWSKAFSGTNKAAYKIIDPQGHAGGMYLRVDDAGTTSARVVGYETMTDVDTGTGPFPTAAQQSGGGYWAKSSAASATAVEWAIIADSRFVIVSIAAVVGSDQASCQRGFGDLVSRRPTGDAFATILNYGSNATSYQNSLDYYANADNTAIAREYTGLGASVIGRSSAYMGTSAALSGNDAFFGTGPNPADGSLVLSRRYFRNNGNTFPRADIPGLFSVPQEFAINSFSKNTYVPASGEFSGRNLLTMKPGTSAAANGYVSFVDITGPWR